MLEVQHLQFPCTVFEFQLIGQIGYWQLKPTRTSELSNKYKNFQRLFKKFYRSKSTFRQNFVFEKYLENLFFQKPEVNLTLFFFFLGGFFQRNLYLYSAPVSLKISVLLLDQFENQEKIEKSNDQKIQKENCYF